MTDNADAGALGVGVASIAGGVACQKSETKITPITVASSKDVTKTRRFMRRELAWRASVGSNTMVPAGLKSGFFKKDLLLAPEGNAISYLEVPHAGCRPRAM